jgi:DNA-binding transcriptional LysR family regulator
MKLNVSWEKLRLFYIVAKHTNITAAANHLNISQSALSRSITWLEERLKVSLFYRHSRGLILTEKGKTLYDTLEKMMNSISIAESTLLEMDKEPKGPLTIGSSSGVISKLLLHDANAFLERYPELELTIVLSDSTPDFSTGEVEAAVFPYIQDKDHFLNQEYLLSFYMKLYASREYLEKFGVPQTPRDLDHHRLISYGTHPHPFANLNWHLSLGCSEGTVRRPYMQVNLGEKIRTLIRQGIGIGTLAFHENTPDLSVHAELVQILTHIEGPQIDFYYIYPKYLEDSLRIKALGDHFKFVIEQQGLAIQQNLKSQPRKIAHKN